MNNRNENDHRSAAAVWEWLEQRKGVLIVGHERPDGDAYAAVLAAYVLFRAAGVDAQAYFSIDDYPYRYRPIFNRVKDQSGISLGGEPRLKQNYDGLVCLDASTWERVDLPREAAAPARENICNIDHHVDNSGYGKLNWINPGCGATAQMILKLAKFRQLPIASPAADLILTGMITDTGGLRFQNTDAELLRDVADLLDLGANYGNLIDCLFFNEPYNKLRLKSRLLEKARFEFGGRLLFATLDGSLLDEFSLAPSETEDCIEALRGVAGVEVVCLIQPDENSVRLSLRSRRQPYDVSAMARRLGGGGHPLAAGIKFRQADTKEVWRRFINVAQEWFETDE